MNTAHINSYLNLRHVTEPTPEPTDPAKKLQAAWDRFNAATNEQETAAAMKDIIRARTGLIDYRRMSEPEQKPDGSDTSMKASLEDAGLL